jgi:enoyl-CoA hydratase
MKTAAVTYQFIHCESQGQVAILTVDRPESLNALNTQVVAELTAAMQQLDADSTIRAVILTGAGNKAFIAGGDIKEMQSLDKAGAKTFSRAGQDLIVTMERMRKPILAAVNGYALGGGLELALACDFIYASDTARLGLPEVTLGVLPGFGGTQTLPRTIGPARAKELIFSGRILTASEALEWGLVNVVYSGEELLEKTLETARRIAANAPVAVANARQAIHRGLERPTEAGLKIENELFSDLFETEDRQEGLQAFLQKRKAGFQGR